MYKNLFLVSFLLFVLVGCSNSTDPVDEASIEGAQTELTEVDQLIGVLENSTILMAYESMPNFGAIIPGIQLPQYNLIHSLKRLNGIENLSKIEEDNPLLSFILLGQITGTYSYDGYEWTHSDEPTNGLILEYDYTDPTDMSTKHVVMSIHDLVIQSYQVAVKIQLFVGEDSMFTLNIDVRGSDLLTITGSPVLESISVDGALISPEVSGFLYNILVVDDRIIVTLESEGMDDITILVEGENLLETDLTMADTASITKITITKGNLEIVIDSPNAEEGDIGDMFYNGTKVADLVIENDELVFVFVNGERQTIDELMPNMFGFTGSR